MTLDFVSLACAVLRKAWDSFLGCIEVERWAENIGKQSVRERVSENLLGLYLTGLQPNVMRKEVRIKVVGDNWKEVSKVYSMLSTR